TGTPGGSRPSPARCPRRSHWTHAWVVAVLARSARIREVSLEASTVHSVQKHTPCAITASMQYCWRCGGASSAQTTHPEASMLCKSEFLKMPANQQAEEVSIMLRRLVRWVAAAREAGSPLFIVHDDSK